eukprot:gb/GFBE01009042.1/.p1 GENE.gb/GFBE01009042.1/~~gb/GFBE01009042.1/.p1  ORF type:complete len:175 (+),score=30.51 gb/GFBE01009042.1/:1-525(+)
MVSPCSALCLALWVACADVSLAGSLPQKVALEIEAPTDIDNAINRIGTSTRSFAVQAEVASSGNAALPQGSSKNFEATHQIADSRTAVHFEASPDSAAASAAGLAEIHEQHEKPKTSGTSKKGGRGNGGGGPSKFLLMGAVAVGIVVGVVVVYGSWKIIKHCQMWSSYRSRSTE